jgi:hypothetical protein
VRVEGGDADEGGNLLERNGPELRHFGEQGMSSDLTDTGPALQHGILLGPAGRMADEVAALLFQGGDFLGQPGEMLLNADVEGLRGC